MGIYAEPFCTLSSVRVAAGDLLRLVEQHDGALPVCLDRTKAGVELLGNVLEPGSSLVATVTYVELPATGPYIILRVDFDVWLDDGEAGGASPREYLSRHRTRDVRALIASAAGSRAAQEGGLKLHPLEDMTTPPE